jgi:hypothetical protein
MIVNIWQYNCIHDMLSIPADLGLNGLNRKITSNLDLQNMRKSKGNYGITVTLPGRKKIKVKIDQAKPSKKSAPKPVVDIAIEFNN